MMETSSQLSQAEKMMSIDELLDERNKLSAELAVLERQFTSATENQTNSIKQINYTQIKIDAAKRISKINREITEIDERMRNIQGKRKVS